MFDLNLVAKSQIQDTVVAKFGFKPATFHNHVSTGKIPDATHSMEGSGRDGGYYTRAEAERILQHFANWQPYGRKAADPAMAADLARLRDLVERAAKCVAYHKNDEAANVYAKFGALVADLESILAGPF